MEETTKQQLKATCADILDLEYKPPNWIWPSFIAEGCLHIIAGEPGAMKSMLSLSFACGKAMGNLWGIECSPREVWYIDRENPLMVAQQRCAAFELTKPHQLCYWGLWAEKSEPPPIGHAVYPIIAEGNPIIIFDSLIRFHRGDENEAKDMASAMTGFRQLCAKGATVIVLHHKGKEKFEGPTPAYRGSSEILGAVDIAFSLAKKEKDDHVQLDLKGIKNRFQATSDLKFIFDKNKGIIIPTELPVLNRDEELLKEKLDNLPGHKAVVYATMTGWSEDKVRIILKAWEGKLWYSAKAGNSILWYPKESK